MTIQIKHAKTNNIPDWTQPQLDGIIAGGPPPLPPPGTVLADITLPTDWNAALTTSMSTNKLLGRGTAGTGSFEEITLGTNLSLTGTTLNATGGGSSEMVGFDSFIITPQYYSDSLPVGLVLNLPAGTASVNGVSVVIPAITDTLSASKIYDYWLNDDGTWTIENESLATYTDLPHYTDKLHVWQITTGASAVSAIILSGNTYPTVSRPNDIAGTIDTFAEQFYIKTGTTNWSATLAVTFGQLLVTTTGKVYQVVAAGTTGASAPTSTASGNITDGSATLNYYTQSSYLGMFRYGANNGVEYYFSNIGLEQVCHKTLLTGSSLGMPAGTEMTTLVKNHIQGVFKHVIAARVNSGTYVFGMKVTAGGYIWLNTTVAGGTAAGSSPFSGSYTPGSSTVTDGTITWLCLYAHYSTHDWFWFNVDRTFLTYRYPDSHDSYAATFACLLARYIQLTGDYSWLTGASPLPSGSGTYWTYQQVFGYIINANLDTQLANGLSKTFQNDISPANGSAFNIQYLEDNCESARGYREAAYIYDILGDTVRRDAALSNLTYIGNGIGGLYDTTYNLFATNYGQAVSSWATNDDIGWYPYLQAQFFPELCNVPVITDSQFKLVRYNVSLKWPNYFNDKAVDGFPNTFIGYLAAKNWQDTAKAYASVEKYERYFINGGSGATATTGGGTNIQEWGYYLATKDALVAPFTVLNADSDTVNFLNQKGEVVSFSGGGVESVVAGTAITVNDTDPANPIVNLNATTANVPDSSNKRYVTDAQLVVIGNTSGTNTGNQTSIVGISGTKAQFDTAVSDGNILYVGDVSQYTDEMAQDAVGAMVNTTLTYVDATPSLGLNLANANTWTAQQTFNNNSGVGALISSTSTSASAILKMQSGNVGATDSSHCDLQFYDGATQGFRFLAAFGNAASARYGGFLAYTDRANNPLPLRFFTTDSGGSLQTTLFLGANQTAGAGAPVGINTASPLAFLHVNGTTEQVRVSYDTSNYYKTTVGSTGIVTFDAVGSGHKFVFSDPVDIGSNDLTLTGSIGATGSRVTKGWFTDVESTNAPTVGGAAVYYSGGTDVSVADGGSGRSTGTTAYSLVATGTTPTGAQQTLANGATTEILVGGGASALPVWTTAQGSGAPVRATSPTITTPSIAKLANLTTNGFVRTSASDGTLNVDTPITAVDNLGLSGMQVLGPVTFNYGSTTAVQIGTTPNNGKRFMPLACIFTTDAASSPTGVSSATIGFGVTGAGYTDTMFIFLDATFNAANLVYQKQIPTTATAVASYAANTAVFAKMGTAISGGTMTGKVSVLGINV